MELTTGKLKTEVQVIQLEQFSEQQLEHDHAYIQGENRWRVNTGRKHDPSYIQGKTKHRPIQRKASIPIEWKK